MAPKDPNDCVVTVTIEIGHQANFLKETSPEGFTHDWTVFVRGYEGSRLEYFVEKVVFKLHKTFKSPVRVITEPPFRVTESGYAGFILPIEIHFKNKQTPRKIVFSYDLFLNAKDAPAINNVRYEKLKFQNPTPEFKAKLIKAGGIEQGPEHPSSDLFSSPVRSEKRALPKIPKEKGKDKEKVKKKKKKTSPQFKSASPAPSLSSLSPMSSDVDDSYTAPPPPPPVKKEKELSVKREGSSSASQPKPESSSSSHKDKSKHRSSSSNSAHKERSDKDTSHKSHKYKDKDKERDRSSSHKDKEAVKKDRDSNPEKVVKEQFESRKEREGSHSSGKSSTSSTQLDNKVAVQKVHKEREKTSQSKDRDTLGSSKEKIHISSKDREKLFKEKHSSHKDVSHTSHSESKKTKEEASNEKMSKENDRHHTSHKRHAEPVDDVEKKKLKRSSSVASTDEKSVKVKSSSGKEKNVSSSRDNKDNKEKESKEVKESRPSSSDKNKHEKSRHSDKHRHSHSSDTKQKESSAKRSEIPPKQEKVSKSGSLTHSERLAMTADFQPQLLLSPLKSKSDEEESPTPSPLPVVKTELKRSTSRSSPDSQSSAVSGEDKSDHEILDPQTDGDKHIVSGLTDSDSDSEEETPYVKSQQKDLKSILNKQSQQTTQVNKSSLQKLDRRVSLEDKQKKVEYEPTEDSAKKYNKAEKRTNTTEPVKSKNMERKMEYPEADVEQVNTTNNTDNHDCNGLDILAPNGMSIGELIAINEQIEKAQTDLNQELLDKVIQVIGETDDFDISEVSLSFDICSVDKNVVLQIQTLLREY